MGAKRMKLNTRLKAKTQRFVVLLALLLPAFVHAQLIGGSQCADRGSSLLWKVEGSGIGDRDIHLFGSIHLGKPEFYPLHPVIDEAFLEAEHLVLELDPRAASDPQVAVQLQLRGMLPAGQTLDQVISAETMRDLEAVMQRMNIPVQNFMNFKPWMVALVLTNLQAAALGYNPLYGIELHLLGRMPAGMNILELESIDEQMDMLESLDPEMFLDYTLAEFESSAEVMEQLIQAWLCADHEELIEQSGFSEELMAGATAAQKAKLDDIYDKMFTRRNRIMADGVGEFAAGGEGDYFVVVGAAHLLGPESVVQMLRDEGFSVTQVPLSP